MKLVLFSDQQQSQEVNKELIDLIGKRKATIGYISSCPDSSRKYYNERKLYYEQMGANVTPYFDLEEGYNDSCLQLILQSDAIHLAGGNTYRFLYWIIRRNLHQRLLEYAQSGKVIIGVSAGSIILTPNIIYSQFCGDKNNINLKNLTGLGLVDFCFVPHAVEENTIDRDIIFKSLQDNTSVVVASDSDWLLVNDSEIKIHGQPKLVVDGKIADVKELLS